MSLSRALLLLTQVTLDCMLWMRWLLSELGPQQSDGYGKDPSQRVLWSGASDLAAVLSEGAKRS